MKLPRLTRAQIDWLLDNLGGPAAPLAWVQRLGRPGGALLTLGQWLLVVVWAVAFVWLWFLVFLVGFALEYLQPASAPASPARSGVSTPAASEKDSPPAH
jgi:hypothetical protein